MNEIRSRMWSGALNVRIVLCDNDSNDMSTRREYFTTINRNTYFPLYFKEFLSYFRPYILVPEWADSTQWWLEFEEVPLKWNLPVGFLYDYLTQSSHSKQNEPFGNMWTLTLHYRDYPDDYIIPLASEKSVEELWVNQIKESSFIQNGTSKPVMNLSKELSSNLWQSVENHNVNLYYSIIQKILPPSPRNLRNVPIKIYLPGTNAVIQTRTPPMIKNTENVQTIGSSLNQLLPELFPKTEEYSLAQPVIQGITPPPLTPLADFYYHTMYLDLFLHIAIVMISQ